jgi:sugar diacid utilization regulator
MSMQINEFIAETIVNKISGLIGKEIMLSDTFGYVLSSNDLSKTHANYAQMQQVVQTGKNLEISKDDFGFVKDPLQQGIIIPLAYAGEIIGALYVQDEPSNYSKYATLIKTTAELLLHQILVIDNVPYKDRIKDGFIFGLLHKKISWDDQRTYDEAELLEVSLHKDKVIMVIYVPGFWQGQFTDVATATEDDI